MDVALRNRYRTMASDSGKDEHITACLFPKIGQRGVPQGVRHESFHAGIGYGANASTSTLWFDISPIRTQRRERNVSPCSSQRTRKAGRKSSQNTTRTLWPRTVGVRRYELSLRAFTQRATTSQETDLDVV